MTIAPLAPPATDLNSYVAAQIRGVSAERGLSHRQLAARMAEPQTWVSRRISPTSQSPVPIRLDEVERFASALGVSVTRLLLPRLDSNQQPAGNPRPQLRVVRDDDVA